MNREHPSDESQDGEPSEAEKKIHAEEAKDRQTTHWDMDYMSAEEIEAAHQESQDPNDEDASSR